MKKNTLLALILTTTIIGCDNNTVDSIVTIDTHIDINVENFTDSLNYTMNTDTQFNLPNMIEGELDVAWLVVYLSLIHISEPTRRM